MLHMLSLPHMHACSHIFCYAGCTRHTGMNTSAESVTQVCMQSQIVLHKL